MNLTFKEKQTLVLGLISQCPFITPLPSCPARGLRELPLEKKIESVSNMDPQTLDMVIKLHKECRKQRQLS